MRHFCVKTGSKEWDNVIKNSLKRVAEFTVHPVYCIQLLLNRGSEPKISQRSCYWFCALKRVYFHTKFNQFLFPFDPLLVWHEAGVILLISAGGSKFQTTMTEQASTPGENSTVHVCISVTCACYCFCMWLHMFFWAAVWTCVHAFLCVCAMHLLLTAIYLCVQAACVPVCLCVIITKLMACMLAVPNMASCNIR